MDVLRRLSSAGPKDQTARLIAAAVMSASFGAAIAQPTASAPIFGWTLGADYASPPRCPLTNRPGAEWCLRSDNPKGDYRLILLLRPAEAPGVPRWLKDNVFLNVNAAGKISGVSAFTVGPENAATIISAVSDRFGKPSKSSTRQAQNAYGASWAVTAASWDLPDVKIDFDCPRRDECSISFFTPDERRAQDERERAARQKDKM